MEAAVSLAVSRRHLSDIVTGWPTRAVTHNSPVAISDFDVLPVDTSTGYVPVPVADEARVLQWATRKLAPFHDIQEGWDSYGARPVNAEAAEIGAKIVAALILRVEALGLRAVPPLQAFPTADGGLSLEWHQQDLDFVISVAPPGDEPPSAYFRSSTDEWEVEDLLVAHGDRFDEALLGLSQVQ
jgi:hypothetical protein